MRGDGRRCLDASRFDTVERMKYLYLTMNDLVLGLRDLVKVRLPKFSTVGAVGVYGPRLKQRLEEIEALPAAGPGGEPFAEELAAKDVEHDGHGGAIWYVIEGCLRSPLLDAELKASLTEFRMRFIPELAELKRTHADEAAAALLREPALETHEKALRAVRLPGGTTLYEWIAAFVQAGKDLDGLLKKRANAQKADRTGIASLRSTAIGQLNRLRATLDDELEGDDDERARVDQGLFAYFDELERRRTPSATPSDTPAPPTPPAPPAPPA